MKCKNCKFNNNAEAKFCVKCGSPLGEKKQKKISLNISKKAIVRLVAIAGVILGFSLIKPLFVGKAKTVLVDGGTFQMGINRGNSPIHSVTVSSYRISKYEITNEQYCEFLNEKGNQKEGGVYWLDIKRGDCQIMKKADKFVPKAGKDKFPVGVSWYGARAYCKWVGGRLPTEAEWEYAARGGNKTKGYKYAGSDNIDEVAWYNKNAEYVGVDSPEYGTHQVGTKKANELGIYDMTGNEFEWCNDWYSSNYYKNSPKENPKGPKKDTGRGRVIRGGNYFSNAYDCSVAARENGFPTESEYILGFRPVFPK